MGRIIHWILDAALALVSIVKLVVGSSSIEERFILYGFLLIVALDSIQMIVKAKQSNKT